jgi:hypothetical protein
MPASEFARLQESITRLNTRQEEHIANNDRQHAKFEARTAEVRKMLTGNGEMGFSERLRNVERVAESVASWGRWIKFGVAGLVMKAVWDIIVDR